jgi:hypothetical protein
MSNVDTNELRKTTKEVVAPRIGKIQTLAGWMVAIGVCLLILGVGFGGPAGLRNLFPAYLYAYLFWIGVTAGSLGLLLLHHTVGGGWGYVIRRFLEAGSRQFVVMLVLFIPIVVTLFIPSYTLYPWALPENQQGNLNESVRHAIQVKQAWLNPTRFLAMSAVYFAFWFAFSGMVNKWGKVLDQRSDAAVADKLNRWGAFGMVLYVIVATFMAVDWLMTLTPDWFSSILGLLTVASHALSTFALMLALFGFLVGDHPLARAVPHLFRDLGNFTLATVMLWAYMSFSQYLIIYSGNTSEEISFYLIRKENPVWLIMGGCLIAFHFAFPFLVLLIGSSLKKSPVRLGQFAIFLVLMRFVDLFWWVAPSASATFRTPIDLSWLLLGLGTPLLIGGIWLYTWANEVQTDQPIVPLQDPRVQASLHEAAAH